MAKRDKESGGICTPAVTTVEDLVERAYDELRPLTALLELTYRCNLLCSFCYNAPKARKELTGDQWIAALDKLKAAGTFKVNLSGGEPFCHKDFFRIAEAVRARGLVLTAYTNAVLLADKDRAARYAALAPFNTEVSLHGANAATHDRLTGIRGSFDKLMVALDHLSQLGVKVTLKTPITRLNQHQLDDIERLGGRFGYSVTYDTNVVPTDDGDLTPLSLAPDERFVVAFFVERMRRGAQGLGPRILEKVRHNCGTGRTTLAVDPYGDVFPCVAWRRPIVNIMEVDDLGAVWRGEGAILNENLAFVRRVSDEVPRATLAAHEAGAFASFCPAVAERETGDAFTFYPAARASARARLAAYRRVQEEKAAEKRPPDSLAFRADAS